MEVVMRMIDEHPASSDGFHGYLVSVGDVAKHVMSDLLRSCTDPNQLMGRMTPRRVAALMELLSGWDLVRTTSYDELRYPRDTTSNPAYLRSPKWLKDLLKNFERAGNQIFGHDMLEGGYMSASVPGIHQSLDSMNGNVDMEAVRTRLADEIDRHLDGLLPDRPMPTSDHMTIDWHDTSHVAIDLGYVSGRHHTCHIDCGDVRHASIQDMSKDVSKACLRIRKRLRNLDMIEAAMSETMETIGKLVGGNTSIEIVSTSIVDLQMPEEYGRASLDIIVSLKAPNHARVMTAETHHVSVVFNGARSGWNVMKYGIDVMAERVRRTMRNGAGLKVDPVVAAELATIDDHGRRALVRQALAAAGERVPKSALTGTRLKRLIVQYGVLGGTVELGNGVTWTNGAVNVRRKLLSLAETMTMTLVGQSIGTIVVHELLCDARIRRTATTDSVLRLHTDARPIALVE